MKRRTLLKALAALPFVPKAHAAPGFQDVIVVGGGPAGVSAALELAERGVRVTLVEAGSRLGGKANGWQETLGGAAVDVEHGVHGWWYQYVHFHDLLQRFGLAEVLRPSFENESGMHTVDGDTTGTGKPVYTLKDRLSLLVKRCKAKGHKNFPAALRSGQRWLKKQRASQLRLELAGKTVADWARRAPLTTYSVFDDAYAHRMYAVAPDQLDAAEYVEGERFYRAGRAKNDRVQWLKGNPDSLIWTPLANALQGLGGRVLLGESVDSLVVDKGRVVGVRLGRRSAEVEIEGPVDSWRAVDLEGDTVWVGPGEDGPVALSSRCTHQGCAVGRSEEGFLCPCHGGRYDDAGQPVSGPPEHPLQPLQVVSLGRKKFKIVRPSRQRMVGAKWVVLAVDVPAAQKLASDLVPDLAELAATNEVVARFWFDTEVAATSRPHLVLDGFDHATNGFLLHRMQDDARTWAESTGGSVIELQAFRGWTDEEPAAQLEACLAEVRRIWPELAEAKVLKQHLTAGDRFTWFKPGWRAHAPTVQAGVQGLLFAGDFVHVPNREAQFMERAVMTGRLAANVALRDLGHQPAAILEPRS